MDEPRVSGQAVAHKLWSVKFVRVVGERPSLPTSVDSRIGLRSSRTTLKEEIGPKRIPLLQQWKQGKEQLPLSQLLKQKQELLSRLPRRSKPGIHL